MRTEDYISTADRTKRLVQLADEIEEKLKSHLPHSRNLELVVLKCHLLIEFMFNQYIDLIAPTEGVLESERFTFKQKESLVHMLGFPSDPLFFPSIDLLNTIRNSVAHTMSIDRKKIDHLIQINSGNPDQVEKLTDSKRISALKSITKYLCLMILGPIEAKHESEFYAIENERRSSNTSRMESTAISAGKK